MFLVLGILSLFKICVYSRGSIDLWSPVIRFSTTCWVKDFLSHDNARTIWGVEFYEDLIRHGYYEGYGRSYPGREVNKNLFAPYGCWFTPSLSFWSNMYINLGSNPLIAQDQHLYHILDLYGNNCMSDEIDNTCLDKYWCREAVKRGYSSIIRHWYGVIEVITCIGGCATVSYNGSCPPTEIRKNYRANDDVIVEVHLIYPSVQKNIR